MGNPNNAGRRRVAIVTKKERMCGLPPTFLLPHISPPPHWQISPASRKVTNALCNQNKSGVMFKCDDKM